MSGKGATFHFPPLPTFCSQDLLLLGKKEQQARQSWLSFATDDDDDDRGDDDGDGRNDDGGDVQADVQSTDRRRRLRNQIQRASRDRAPAIPLLTDRTWACAPSERLDGSGAPASASLSCWASSHLQHSHARRVAGPAGIATVVEEGFLRNSTATAAAAGDALVMRELLTVDERELLARQPAFAVSLAEAHGHGHSQAHDEQREEGRGQNAPVVAFFADLRRYSTWMGTMLACMDDAGAQLQSLEALHAKVARETNAVRDECVALQSQVPRCFFPRSLVRVASRLPCSFAYCFERKEKKREKKKTLCAPCRSSQQTTLLDAASRLAAHLSVYQEAERIANALQTRLQTPAGPGGAGGAAGRRGSRGQALSPGGDGWLSAGLGSGGVGGGFEEILERLQRCTGTVRHVGEESACAPRHSARLVAAAVAVPAALQPPRLPPAFSLPVLRLVASVRGMFRSPRSCSVGRCSR